MVGNEALSGRYIRFDDPTVHTTNVMMSAQSERFFMAGDEAQLVRIARALTEEIPEGWTLPGSLDLSG